MTPKIVVKRIVKKRRLKAHVKASKSLYFLLLGLGFCVVVWFGYQVFNQAIQGYKTYNIEKNVKAQEAENKL